MKRFSFGVALAAMLSLSTSLFAADPAPAQPASTAGIKGTMTITFNTRTNLDQSGDLKAGSSAIGAKDVYQFESITVNDRVRLTGKVERQPNLYSKVLQRRKQNAQLYYSLDVSVINPKNTSQVANVGKWVGTVPIDQNSGTYMLAGSSDSKFRIDVRQVGQQPAFIDYFEGKLVGKAEKKDDLAGYTFKRIVGNKEVQVVVKRSDPMTFDMNLSRGPSGNYGRCNVKGRLDYDYETGNYYTDGLTFTNDDGTSDIVTGSIKWVPDADRKNNGKGQYEFNLRWNEQKFQKKGGEDAAFAKGSDEDAFFAVDNSVPSLTGTVAYADTFIDASKEEPDPSVSKVTYNLKYNAPNEEEAKKANDRTMKFAKMWFTAIGPTNDE